MKFKLLYLLAFISVPVNAQGYMDIMGMNINAGNMVLEQHRMNDMLENAGDSDSDDDDDTTIATPEISVDSFNYSPSMSSRRANMSKFASSMKKLDPTNAAGIDQIFDGGQVIGQIEKAMKPMGLRANNVADAYAFWWVVAWYAVNSKTELPSREAVLSVKQQATSALASTTLFTSASNTTKQEMAESLLVQAALIDSHIDAAAGNPTQQTALAKAVNQGAKKMGLDLTTMDLTENGFVPRSGGRSDAADAVEGADPSAVPTEMAANDDASAGESDTGKLALYGVGGVALLAGMFALGKSFDGKG